MGQLAATTTHTVLKRVFSMDKIIYQASYCHQDEWECLGMALSRPPCK